MGICKENLFFNNDRRLDVFDVMIGGCILNVMPFAMYIIFRWYCVVIVYPRYCVHLNAFM